MKKNIVTLFLSVFGLLAYSQADDTLSTNIYQKHENLGVGVSNPSQLLQLESDISSGTERNLLGIHNTSVNGLAYSGISLKTGVASGYSVIQDYGINYAASPSYDFAGFLNISNSSKGIMLHANSDEGVIKMFTGHDSDAGAGVERMRIDFAGNIGIGTKAPKARLEIADGDIFISDIEKGIIMKSPNGKCWRGVLDNNGQLSFSQIVCFEEISETNATSKLTTLEPIVTIFPNPTKGELIIEIPENETESFLKYYIFSMRGDLIKTGALNLNYTRVDISSYYSGNYFLQVKNNNNDIVNSQEFIKE